MKNGKLFHSGIYFEGLKRLRAIGITAFAIITLSSLNTSLSTLVFSFGNYNYFEHYDPTLLELHPALVVIPFLTVIFTLITFSFQNKRRDCDFYHSLPLTKTAINTSLLAAILTWVIFITLVSTQITLISMLPFLKYFPNPLHMIQVLGGTVGGSLLAMSLTFLALTLSGNTITAFAMTAMFLFGPRLFITGLIDIAVDSSDIVPYSYSLFDKLPEGLLYSQYDSLVAWIGSLSVAAVVFVAAFWLGARRKSETAGRASVSRVVQAFMHIVFTMLCSIPAILQVHNNVMYYLDSGSYYYSYPSWIGVFFLYAFTIVAFLLYELITTKSAKSMLYSIPLLFIVGVLNVAAIFGATAITGSILAFQPTADEISSVSVTSFHYYSQEQYYYDGYYESVPDLESTNREFLFDRYRTAVESGYYDDVKLKDDETKKAISDALIATIDNRDNYSDYSEAYYDIDVIIYTGGIPHERNIQLSESQADILLAALDEAKPIGEAPGYL